MRHRERPLVWLHGEVSTPPLSRDTRRRAGFLLRLLQQGLVLTMPISRPMPVIGERCHELRIIDGGVTWRLVYRLDTDAVIILDVFQKKTRTTPKRVIAACRKRLRNYDNEN